MPTFHDIKVQFYRMKRVKSISDVDGSTYLYLMYSIPLNCTLKNG